MRPRAIARHYVWYIHFTSCMLHGLNLCGNIPKHLDILAYAMKIRLDIHAGMSEMNVLLLHSAICYHLRITIILHNLHSVLQTFI